MTARAEMSTLRRWGWRTLAPAAALALVLAAALPADAQARRTRPPENQGSSGGQTATPAPSPSPSPSGGSSSGSSNSGTASRPTPRPGGPAVDTRPPGRSGGGVISVDRRSHRGYYPGHYPYDRHYGSYPGYYGFYGSSWYPYRFSWWLGYSGWYGWPDYPYYVWPHTYPYGYYGPYGYGEPVYYGSRERASMGALDLDLKPGDTQIWLNGQYIGVADNFDGWPQYLWLEEGDYHFVFFYEGRRTIAREYHVYPGVVLDVEDRLERGESTPPQELFPPPTERRDARIQENEAKRRQAAAESADWRERSEAIRRQQAEAAEGGAEMEPGMAPGAAEDFGSLALTIEPPDASVYLDGRFLGTAEDLVRLRRGLTVDAGEHQLSVVRPGYAPQDQDFEVAPGEEVRLTVRLDRQ